MVIQRQHDDNQRGSSGKRPRLMIDITPELRRRIKIAAAQSDLTIYEYVGRILEQSVPLEENLVQKQRRGLNPSAVEDLLRTSEGIMSHYPGQIFEDSVEALRQIREQRIEELEQR
jgi:hypothetical protein